MAETMEKFDRMLEQYALAPETLEQIISGLSDAQLNLSLGADTWSIRQTVHHIVDGDDLWNTCIKAAIGNGGGIFTLQWYWDVPQTEWAEKWKYGVRDVALSLALFRANRNQIADLLRRSPDAWEKSIRIKFPGREEERISVEDVVSMHNRHILGHAEDIRKIRQSHGV